MLIEKDDGNWEFYKSNYIDDARKEEILRIGSVIDGKYS